MDGKRYYMKKTDKNKEFNPFNQNIYELFTSESSYDVPNYQRQYAWNNEQLGELWDNLYDSFQNNPNQHYFLGSIVVVDDKKGHYSIVDGQQRLTTLMIMLNVLTKTYPNLKKRIKNFDKLIYVNVKDNVKKGKKIKPRLQLQTDPSYDTDFSNIIIKPSSYEKVTAPTLQDLKKDQPKYKFQNACKFFYDKFNDLYTNKQEFNKFIDYILFNVEIIKIECYNEAFAIKLFLVMNDTGLDLAPSDIIKVYLLDSYDKDDPDYEKDKVNFNTNWKSIESNCVKHGVKLDELLVYYEYFKLKHNPKTQLINEMKQVISENDTDDIMAELSSFAENLSKIYAVKDNTIYSLLYIPWSFYVNACILTAYSVNYDDKDELFKQLRRFFYLSWIAGKTLNGIKQTSFNIIAAIAEEKSIDDIKQLIADYIKKNDIIRNVYQNLNGDVYGENFLKPLMLTLEYEIRESANTAFYECNQNIHMDHILPQKFYNKKDEWPQITDVDAAMPYINKLGNMELLLGKKNEEALNFSIHKKVQIILGEDQHKTGRVTFDTTNVIIDQYNKDKTWDIQHIIDRQAYLIGLTEKAFEFSENDVVDNNLSIETNSLKSRSWFKWNYQNGYYSNIGVIREIIKNYVLDNKIINYDQIADVFKEYKLNSLPIISTVQMNNGYTYTLLKDIPFELYVTGICEYGDVLPFVETIYNVYPVRVDSLIEKLEKEKLYLYFAGEVLATGYYLQDNRFLVEKGSKIKEGIAAASKDIEETLLNERKCSDIVDGVYVNDHIYSSPSTASNVILGRHSNGRDEWISSDKRTLNQMIDEISDKDDN